VVIHSNEWAIDVRGLSGAVINDNVISGSNFGAMSIWDSSNNQIESNSMSGDDRAGMSSTIHCSGVNQHGTSSNNNYTGNSGSDTLFCSFP
jgi:parallel beta-helix repeat protein